MIIIIGASKGIGKFLLHKFRSESITVVGTFNSASDNSDNLFKVDVTDFNQITAFIETQKLLLSDITLINCAGITYNAFAHKSDPELWKNVIDVNLIGTYNCIRARSHQSPIQTFRNL